MSLHLGQTTLILLFVAYAAGMVAAVIALFQSRTPQGAAAWIVSLIFFPFLSIPLFILFGKRRLKKYADFNVLPHYPIKPNCLQEYEEKSPEDPLTKFFCSSEHPQLKGHKLKLLVDGRKIFPEMLDDIDQAKEFILLQMFLIRSDDIGNEFFMKLALKASQGVKVYVLYENIAVSITKESMELLKKSGVHLGKYNPMKNSMLLANFRNHKKLLIIDNEVGYWGGVNIGNDYLGLYKEIGHWRDTNVRVEGPALMIGKKSFAKDWEWSQKSRIEINWDVPSPRGDSSVFILNSDPSTDRTINLLQHIEMINQSTKKVWIANPYIVPPQGLMDALLIACIRGVEIRILVPGKSDNPLVSSACEVYYERLLKAGVRIYRFNKGMMHQKIMLSDDKIAMIGSSNFDFRSMYINFENGLITTDEDFVLQVEEMLAMDFRNSTQLTVSEFRNKKFSEKLTSRFCNVLAPIL